MQLPALKWRPTPNGEERTKPVSLIVLHDCQGGYEGAIATFLDTTPGDRVSAHLVLKEDGSEVTQMVAFDRAAWHCVAFNQGSIGLEMAGFAERGFPDAEWQTAANVVAYLCHAFGLPAQWAHGGAGRGFTSHFDLGKRGGGHSDPTTDPHVFAGFVNRVQAAYAAGGFPHAWGRGLPTQASVPPVPNPTQGLTVDMPPAEMQAALNAVGVRPLLIVDGDIGPRTTAAITRFQSAHGLFADGQPNARTITPEGVSRAW